ncbi:hypothetical protein [Aestuariirhabdus sp. LZHN29]|uniref:hypothetical protein n=1 Tax=Aestuariirhabdus sp. LZHN29 TaxID=3417462 RepID=UPI003CEF5859
MFGAIKLAMFDTKLANSLAMIGEMSVLQAKQLIVASRADLRALRAELMRSKRGTESCLVEIMAYWVEDAISRGEKTTASIYAFDVIQTIRSHHGSDKLALDSSALLLADEVTDSYGEVQHKKAT